MQMLTSKEELSFYCDHCDKWVDGIEGTENQPGVSGMGHVLCDECGGDIWYRLPSFWRKLRRRASQFFANAFDSSKE